MSRSVLLQVPFWKRSPRKATRSGCAEAEGRPLWGGPGRTGLLGHGEEAGDELRVGNVGQSRTDSVTGILELTCSRHHVAEV